MMMIIWITGQPGAGKTTLAQLLVSYFCIEKSVFNIDGDNLRKHFPPEGGYNPDGRRENIRRAQKLAAMMAEQIDVVAVSLVSPFRDMREEFKKENEVLEVYLHTTEIRGREDYFAPDYEPPEKNFLPIDTGETTEEEALAMIVKEVRLILDP